LNAINHYPPLIMAGSQVLNWGKAIRTPKKTTSTAMKGSTPRMSSPVGIRKAPLTRNRFNPTGGVISAISILTVTSTPNHTRSKPRELTSGIKRGIVTIRNVFEGFLVPSHKGKT